MSQTKIRSVAHQITGIPTTDGAGVELVRVIGQPGLMDLDPFLLFDAFRSDNPNDYIAGFPLHPHRGFETLTYLIAGRMRHQDNAGNAGVIEPGGIQWMTAGKGILHSEMPEQENGLLEGFQLWINLPASHKMTAPHYQEYTAEQIPQESRDGTQIRVITGTTSEGTCGPVSQPLTEPLFLDINIAAGVAWSEVIVPTHNAFIYVIAGSLTLTSTLLVKNQIAVLDFGSLVQLIGGETGARFLLVAGKPLREPIVRGGPFVMNTRAELQQAVSDYQSGQL